ncbi:hypothetical protein NPIL_162471 [Nephila pilipes]|uniref:Uncharacterized protein n=1 Tax=Nephila pilipes TaxID=299642 RepID=A0A8X6U014_NEPPI|nr:hypothetical protein NPIL_162471 [Nephila pilipes]
MTCCQRQKNKQQRLPAQQAQLACKYWQSTGQQIYIAAAAKITRLCWLAPYLQAPALRCLTTGEHVRRSAKSCCPAETLRRLKSYQQKGIPGKGIPRKVVGKTLPLLNEEWVGDKDKVL